MIPHHGRVASAHDAPRGSCRGAPGDDVRACDPRRFFAWHHGCSSGAPVDIPRLTPGSGDLQAELQRLEREIEELRTRLAQDETRRGREGRSRRLARTSRADSQLIGSRPLRVVSSTDDPMIAEAIASVTPIGAARAKGPTIDDDDDDDGPQAA